MKASEFLKELRSKPSTGIIDKAIHFAASLAVHAADGMRKCDASGIAARLEICKGCEQYDGQGCKVCGCNCNGRQVFMNKLAWASESCPLGKWGPKGDEVYERAG